MPRVKGEKGEKWIAVQEEYFQNVLSVKELAEKYGLNPATISSRASREGWPRQPKQERAKRVKDRLVQDAMALGGTPSPDTREKMIEAAVSQDVADMNLGLRNARKALELSHTGMTMLEKDDEGINPVALKSYMDSSKTSIEVIRRIRGLDEKDGESEMETMTYDDLKDEFESLKAELDAQS